MRADDFLDPEVKTIEMGDGTKRDYVLSRFPAVQGRQIITQYPITGAPKIGEYGANEGLMLKMMGYVAAVRDDGEKIVLSTEALVNNHVTDAEGLMRIEMAMMEKNCSFFRNGKGSTFFEGIVKKVIQSITSTLTGSLPASKVASSPQDTN